ncbi:MAG: glycine cleavage system aminomethyltransferase GcvT, partial [Chloroflexi bacterium]|nr:glycine cleavage system aminomethyltransferase GcvT [Chloroflexota bacterium]
MEHGSQPLKRSPLDRIHRQLGARMVEFAGWELPVQYSDIIGEHLAVRTRAGLFDISHLGELEVRGEGALEFLQGMLTNDLSSLSVGHALYTVMCHEHGGTVDDFYVYRLDRDRYWLVVNAANAEKDLLWLMEHCAAGVIIEDLSAATGKVDLQGPLAQRILQPLVDVDLSQLSRFQFSQSRLAGIDLLISRTGYTGEDGFEI